MIEPENPPVMCGRTEPGLYLKRSVQSWAKISFSTRQLPVAFCRKSPFLYFLPRDKQRPELGVR